MPIPIIIETSDPEVYRAGDEVGEIQRLLAQKAHIVNAERGWRCQ
jgi:hypothetical protein